ncbi:hypothetical protein PoB_005181300 [Plakobranchus ocellatus]|uniref:Uncharacterized protein n=1 Tax=Plakobranchus ocellatus TaxID=259542 RepID=A0AAV4C1J6_9GAST|nr:hypothetical protein PoB_005181300 [Plakobranchus ocellatus]
MYPFIHGHASLSGEGEIAGCCGLIHHLLVCVAPALDVFGESEDWTWLILPGNSSLPTNSSFNQSTHLIILFAPDTSLEASASISLVNPGLMAWESRGSLVYTTSIDMALTRRFSSDQTSVGFQALSQAGRRQKVCLLIADTLRDRYEYGDAQKKLGLTTRLLRVRV